MSSVRHSAGLLPYRTGSSGLEVLIAHMGGPYWGRKDEGAWTIVKGEHDSDEDPFAAACREFAEETGLAAPAGTPLPLGEVRQSGPKIVIAWAVEAPEIDAQEVRSNTFTMEWPRGSGEQQEFPEIDRAGWFEAAVAKRKLVRAQAALVEALERELG